MSELDDFLEWVRKQPPNTLSIGWSALAGAIDKYRASKDGRTEAGKDG